MKKTMINLSFVVYLVSLISILFLGTRSLYMSDGVSFAQYLKFSSNIVPFKTISIYVNALFDGSLNINIPVRNLLGNLLMFLPMGIYLPYYFKKVKKISTFMFSMIVLLLFIEGMQMATRLGSFDIDDIILNMVGAIIGYGIWKTKIVQELLKV